MTSGTSYSPPPAYGRFKLLHQIGAGVLGPVFRTHDPDNDRLVSVKAFTLDITPEQAEHLAAELQRLVDLGLEHPHIAAPLGAGVEDYVAYLASAYAAGESLDAAIRQYGPAPAGDGARLIAHVGEALDAAAAAGVFHGSLHPRDILVTPGETHMTGLGVAKALERIGLHGPIRRPYVAPERESGDEWGAAADIYSLAAIAYEVLTGRRALPGTDQPLAGLSDVRAHDAERLREVIEAGVDPDPGRRPARAGDFAAAFADALLDGGVSPVQGERQASHRPRKARSRLPKLPGMDEPLITTGPSVETLEAAPVPASPAVAEERAATAAFAEAAGASSSEAAAPVREDLEPEPLPVPELEPEAEDRPEVELAPTVESELEAESPEPEPPASEPPVPERHDEPVVEPSAEIASPKAPEPRVRMRRRQVALSPVEPLLEPVAAANGGVVATPEPSSQAEPAVSEVEAGAAAGTGEPEAEPIALDLPDLAEPDGPAPAAGVDALTGIEDLRISFTPAVVDLAAAESVPKVHDLNGEFAKPGPSHRRESARRAAPIDDFREPGALASEPPVPRAFDPQLSAEGPRVSRAFEPEPYRAVPQAPSVRIPVAIGVGIGLVVGLLAGYLLWAGTGQPDSILPPAIMAEVKPPSATPPGSSTPSQVLPPTTQGRTPQPVIPKSTRGDGSAPTPPAVPAPAKPAPAKPVPAKPAPAKPVPEKPVGGTPAAAKEPRPAPVAAGVILVRSIPSTADVYVEGERKGVTPKNLRNLPFGSYTIRVSRPGYVTRERVVTLDAQHAEVRATFTLARGKPGGTAPRTTPEGRAGAAAVVVATSISVETQPPGARVRLDGKNVGVTPLTLSPVTPGTHGIEFRLPGYKPWSTKVTVVAGQRQRVTASLERDTPR